MRFFYNKKSLETKLVIFYNRIMSNFDVEYFSLRLKVFTS